MTGLEGDAEAAALAVRAVYTRAGLDPDSRPLGIVPLYELTVAYPIRTAEVKGLTHRKAGEFLAAEIGQPVPVPDHPERPLAGFLYGYLYAGALYGCILVNRDDPVVRRRFSAAHELGHYVLHFLPLLERQAAAGESEALIVAEGLAPSDEGKDDSQLSGEVTLASGDVLGDVGQMEREANTFAAELLMPAAACRALVERLRQRLGASRQVLARRLASEFLVSQEAMRRRLDVLGLPEEPARAVPGEM